MPTTGTTTATTRSTTTPAEDGDDLRVRYHRVRGFTEGLAEPLSPEDQTVQTMPDVSPTKWHRAHTTWFFETFVLGPHQAGYAEFDPAYAYLFNSYYETVGPRHARPQRGLLSRPGVAEIGGYRDKVDEAMDQLLAGRGTDLAARVPELVELGLHHEQQHQELLLMDIKHVLAVNPLRPAYRGFDARARRRQPARRRPQLDRAHRGRRAGRLRRRRLLLRQRDAASRRTSEPLRHPIEPGDGRRLAGVHHRGWLPGAGTVDVRRLGDGSGPRAGRGPSTGAAPMTAGWSRPLPVPGRWTPTNRCAT